MTLRPQPTATSRPWYRHFWPWFLVVLLSAAVSGSLATAWLAFAHRDSLVSDDWYADGATINRSLELERSARRHGVTAMLDFDAATGKLEIALRGSDLASIEWLELELSHPTQAERDRRLLLQRVEPLRYSGAFGEALVGRWYARLEPLAEREGRAPAVAWRLTGTLGLPAGAPIRLGGPE